MLNSPSQDFSDNAATVETTPDSQHGTPPMNPEYVPPYDGDEDDDNSSWSSVLPPLPEEDDGKVTADKSEQLCPSDRLSVGHDSERCPSVIEADPERGTIRVEEEQEQKGETRRPLLTPVQQCWLIVFFRKWARKTKTCSYNTFKKYGPKVKRAAKRSATVVKDASIRSASFVAAKSSELKVRAVEFSATHDLPNKAKQSVETVKKASTKTAKGMKQASVATLKGMKEFESKHQLVFKSKRGLSKSGKFIRKAWRGETANREQENNNSIEKMSQSAPPTKVPPSSE